jgi:hypothetical protein
MSTNPFPDFATFYPYYLGEHQNRTCRRLHVIGSFGVLLILALVATGVLPLLGLLGVPVCGYGFAWVGHFFFEHNKPATFQHPFYSLLGDWVMFKDVLIGKIPF